MNPLCCGRRPQMRARSLSDAVDAREGGGEASLLWLTRAEWQAWSWPLPSRRPPPRAPARGQGVGPPGRAGRGHRWDHGARQWGHRVRRARAGAASPRAQAMQRRVRLAAPRQSGIARQTGGSRGREALRETPVSRGRAAGCARPVLRSVRPPSQPCALVPLGPPQVPSGGGCPCPTSRGRYGARPVAAGLERSVERGAQRVVLLRRRRGAAPAVDAAGRSRARACSGTCGT
jgi:hypothetical protein